MDKVKSYIMCLFIIVSHLHGVAQESTIQQYNRSQLIQYAANICIAGLNDETACNVLSDAAREFDIQALDEYVTLLRNRRLDLKNKKAIEATTALLSRAEEVFGKETMEAARCRRACLNVNFETNIDWSVKLSDVNVVVAKQLYERERNNWKKEEFYRVSGFPRLVGSANQE